MQYFDSIYCRQPIEVSDECPTVAIRIRLARLHVAVGPGQVAAMIRKAVKAQRRAGNDAWTQKREEEAVGFALWEHAENLGLYEYIMGGM